MIYLLDTHTFLWLLFSPSKLSKRVQGIVLDQRNEIYVSSVSFWEISLKYNLGKLKFPKLKPESLPDWAEETGLEVLDLTAKEAASFYQLPKTDHKDPFDRMLIWQSIHNGATLLSKDASMKGYQKLGLRVDW